MLRLRTLALACLLLIVAVGGAAGKKKKEAPEQFSSLSFVVLRESDGRPVKNASVVIHFLRKDGSQESEGLQLKTDSDGRTAIQDMPFGKLRVQVVAHKMQTYGDDVEVNQAEQEFVIRLKPPADEVSNGR
jgi:5-hydroxyisourate hydrolase-like protein (transthyretin family)